METHVLYIVDLQELIRGNRVVVGPVCIVIDPRELQKALTALDPIRLRDPDHTRVGVELLRDVGIDLDAKKDT